MQNPFSTIRIENAAARGREGYSCSEAVLTAFAPALGLDETAAMRLSSGFAGGMGLTGETCGVVTAAFLTLGLRYGPTALPENAGDENAYRRQRVLMLVMEFSERFRERHGSLLCRELCRGMDIRTPEGARAIRESGRAEQLIRSATELLRELADEEK